jgi:hypothetical protein
MTVVSFLTDSGPHPIIISLNLVILHHEKYDIESGSDPWCLSEYATILLQFSVHYYFTIVSSTLLFYYSIQST